MEHKSSEVHFIMSDDDKSTNIGQELEAKIDAFRLALQQKDDESLAQITKEFMTLWNSDIATNQFYNPNQYKQFCSLVELKFSKQQNVTLDRELLAILRFLPPTKIERIHAQLSETQDPKMWEMYIDLLVETKNYIPLISLADANGGVYFDKIQDIIANQHDDPICVLEFVKKYGERANVSLIALKMTDYTFALSHQKGAKAEAKYKKYSETNRKIDEINREIRAKKAEQRERQAVSQRL